MVQDSACEREKSMGLKKEVPNVNDDNPVCMRKGDSVEEKIITSALAK